MTDPDQFDHEEMLEDIDFKELWPMYLFCTLVLISAILGMTAVMNDSEQ